MMADMSTAGDGRVERSLADRDATLAELHRDLYRWSRGDAEPTLLARG
jgi:hypothetical protein